MSGYAENWQPVTGAERLRAAFMAVLGQSSSFAEEVAATKILFTNVSVFDGVNDELMADTNVQVVNNLVQQISAEAIKGQGAQVIDGGGRTLMPGLVDNHVHLSIVTIKISDLLSGDPG